MKKLLYGAALILPLAMAAANADAFWHRDVHHNAEANARDCQRSRQSGRPTAAKRYETRQTLQKMRQA